MRIHAKHSIPGILEFTLCFPQILRRRHDGRCRVPCLRAWRNVMKFIFTGDYHVSKPLKTTQTPARISGTPSAVMITQDVETAAAEKDIVIKSAATATMGRRCNHDHSHDHGHGHSHSHAGDERCCHDKRDDPQPFLSPIAFAIDAEERV